MPDTSAPIAVLAADDHLQSRHLPRYSHISIGLWCWIGAEWIPVRALGWNDQGFNFSIAQEIEQDSLNFKRGTSVFEGEIVWKRPSADSDSVVSMLLNELLFMRIGEMSAGHHLRNRLIKLIRSSGMVAEKTEILTFLGVDLEDHRIDEMMASRRLDRQNVQYGVKVISKDWETIVEEALKVSSVVLSLEKVTGSFKFS